jgi:DNA sulfur modification protein DndD
MAIVVQIAGWEAQGLRCPDHKISFEDGERHIYPISLIQMPNGTGKTTTLEMLRAALSGAAADDQWDRAKIYSMRKRGNDRGRGLFRVVLIHNGRRLTITMNFDFEEKTIRYSTTITSGIKEGFHPPLELKKFLRPEFIRFFVFDGELAEQLLSRDHTDAEKAINALFQLGIFASLTDRVRMYWEQQTAGRTAKGDRGLAQRRNKVTFLRQRIAALKQEQAQVKKDYKNIRQELQRKKARFNEALLQQRNLRNSLEKAASDLANATASVRTATRDVLECMRSPHALSAIFAQEMITFKASLDRVKLPESTAREFFEELAEESYCVCGRELDDEIKKIIRERATQYLGSEDVALLNAIKGDVADLIGTTADAYETGLKNQIDTLRENLRIEAGFRAERDAIQAEGVANDPTLAEVQEEIERLEQRVRSLQKDLEQYEDTTDTAADEDTYGIEVLETKLEESEKRLAEITQTLGLKRKCDLLVSVLERAQAKASIGIRDEICAETNGRISELMPYNAIRVEDVSRCLVLSGQEGGSAGETLSVAYAFLATLFNRSDHQLPFIVDSPANPIDLMVRAKVAELIPRLTRQFVAFTISSERQGFLPSLEQSTQGSIQYLTLFKKGAKGLEQMTRNEADFREFTDGFCVSGRKFFQQFHLDVEEANSAV